jgi:hypothetical protein
VTHVLLYCRMWDNRRTQLRESAGERWGDVSFLLGGKSNRKERKTGKVIDDTPKKWRPDLEIVRETIRFLKHTGIFVPQPLGNAGT